MSHAYYISLAADLLASELVTLHLGGREKEKAKMIPVNWIAPLRLLKCLEGGKVETIDLLDALSIIFI